MKSFVCVNPIWVKDRPNLNNIPDFNSFLENNIDKNYNPINKL